MHKYTRTCAAYFHQVQSCSKILSPIQFCLCLLLLSCWYSVSLLSLKRPELSFRKKKVTCKQSQNNPAEIYVSTRDMQTLWAISNTHSHTHIQTCWRCNTMKEEEWTRASLSSPTEWMNDDHWCSSFSQSVLIKYVFSIHHESRVKQTSDAKHLTSACCSCFTVPWYLWTTWSSSCHSLLFPLTSAKSAAKPVRTSPLHSVHFSHRSVKIHAVCCQILRD